MRTFACTIVLTAMMIPVVALAQQEPGPNKGPDGNPSAPGVQPGGDLAKAKAELQRKQMELELQVRRDDIQLKEEVHLLCEELRIKNARLAKIDPRHRPHYPATERMAILELKAARGWSLLMEAIWAKQNSREWFQQVSAISDVP
jgi:hypothetical protein